MTTTTLPERNWRAVALFLVVAFAFSWGYVAVYDALLAHRFAGTTAGRITPYLAAWGPLVAVAFVLRRSETDLRAWFDRQLTVRNPLSLYLFAFLLPNFVSSAAMAVFPAYGVGLALSISAVNFVLVFGFTFATLGALEEFGWRGYLQPMLQARTNAVVAAVAVGLVWGLWHLPSHLLGYLGDRNLWLFLLHLVPMSVVMAWLYNSADGIVPVMVFHAAHNAPGNVFSVTGEVPSTAVSLYYPVYTGLWLLVGAAFVAYYGFTLASDGDCRPKSGGCRLRT